MDTHASFNKSFRLVWSAARGAWVAVAETARGRGKAGRRRRTGAARAAVLGTGLAAATAFAAPPSTTPPAATQLPTGGQVVAGQAALAQSGATLTVTQSSSRAAIDWQTFDLGAQARIDFRQPDANAVTLNRVLATDGSRIFGRISAPGQVFLLNPNGVLFGATAQVDVGGLVASTLSLSDADFMAGRATFGADGAAGTGAIVNDGTLAAKAGGYVALLAPQVRNEGVIVATEGTVALAAGDQVTLQFGGTRPIAVQVDRAAVDALVANGRAIRADGGLVVMSARSASALLDTVVADTGTVSADTLAEHGGRIVLEGGGRGVVEVAGTLQARGTAAGTTGGTVLVTGDRIHVQDGARLDASGTAGGGSVLVGGGWHGAPAIAQASATVVDPGAILDASATRRGNGGTVEAWSDVADASGVTRAEGTFLAQGGPQGGDGGRIETSGHWLDTATARGGAAAAQGAPGSWLFDPYDVSIVSGGSANASQSGGLWTPTGSSSQIQNTQIQALLEAGTSVTVTTGSSGSELGDISVLAPISKTAGAADVTLTLRAANTIAVEQPIANTGGGGKLAVVLSADDDNGVHDGNGAILLDADITTGGGALAFGSGASMTINNVATLVGGDVFVAGSGRRTISTGGGGFTVNGEMLIANPSGLEIDTAGGNVAFGGLVNSGDGYALVNTPVTWAQAFNLAKSGTGADPGDTYLATITSRLENAVASRTANYAGAWLGGHRGPTDGTTASVDDQWRWVTGPEGLANGGTGTVFYTVASGSTAAGLYSNWAPGEPNNTLPGYPGSPVPTSLNGESALQFSGSAGQWNDLADGIGRVDGNPQAYLVETRLANSPLTINAGTGSVSFANAVGGLKPLASLSVTAAQASVGGAVAISGAQVWATPVSGTGLTLTGSAITLDGAVTATGGATITSTAGNVTLAAGLASDGDVAVTAAGGGLTGAGGIALTGATGVLTVTQDGNTTYSGNVSGADASLVKAGAGILGLSGANAFPQGIALDGGELELDSGGAIGSSGTIGFAGGTLRFTPANDADCSARFSNAPGQAYSFDVQGAAVSFASDLTSAGGTLAVRGTDVVELDGNNTYDGGTTVHGGTLFGGGGSMTRTAFGSGAITVEPGATLWTDRGTLGNALVLAGGKLMGTNGFGEVWSGSVDVTADSTIEAWYYVTLSGAIGGSGKLTKTESGVLTIAGADTRAAGYVVSAGTLQVGAGGTTGSVAGDIVDDASLAFDRSDTVTYAGTISGTGDVHQAGHGKTALAGTLAYTGATSIDAGTLAIHADVPSYATSGFSGAGTLAIEPASASFPSAYTFSLAFPSLGGLVLGKAGNTADITLGAATTVAGPVTIQGGNVSLANNLTVSTASPILVQATGDIVQSSGVTVSTHGGSVTYQSNAAGAGAGYIWLAGQGQATTISTSGGAITLSGGTNVTTGWAVGAASGNGNGVTLDDASLASAGGTVTIRGQGYAGSPVAIATTDGSVTSADGVRLAGGSAIAAGGGRIAVTGDAPGLGTAIGVDLGSSTASVLSSTSAVSGAIVVTGSSDGAGADTSIGVATGLATLQETGNGGIQLLGSGRDDAVLAGSGSSVLARVGAIVLQGTTGGLGTAVDVEGVVGQKAGSAVPASTSSVTLSSDHLAIGGTVQAGGTLTLSPSTAATNVQLATTGSGLVLPASWFGTNVSGFSTLVVGRTDGSGTLTVGALTWGGALTLDDGAGAIQLTGALDIGTHAMTVSGNGSIAETAAGGITATSLRLVGTGSYDLSLGTNGVGTLAARTGSVAYVNGRALTIGTLSGTVGVTSLSSGTLDVETTGGQLTVASAVSTGNTGASAVRLVAGSSVAAGTAAGGDVVISGAPSIATGAGGRATLYTGSLAGSTGVAARVGSGSGRFRYDSSVGTPNFTTSLGTGLYAVYREQPAVTITAGGAAKTYDGQAWSGGNGYGAAGWVNGDTAAALAGTITYAGSAQGALDAGSYAIAPGGLSTGLGYGVTYANGTLVVSPKTVSLSAAKVYDGGTDLAGAVSIVTGVAGETLGYTGATASDAHVATAGKYVSAIMLADGTGLASNYVLPALDAAHAPVTITPRPLTPTAAIGGTLSKTYDGTNAAPGATVSGSVAGAIAGDTLTLDLSGVSLAYNGSHVAGTSAVVATGSAALDIASSAAGSVASDYAFAAPTIADAAASITPRTLTSTASIGGTLAKTYDGTNAAPGATVSGSVAGAIAGDTLTLDTSGVQLAYDGIHVVGTGTVVASGSASFGIGSSAAGSVASDYALTQPTIAAAPASITPRTLSATAAIGGTLAKTYDGTTAATAASITGSVTGAIAGDMLVLDATGVSLAYDGAHVTGAHQIAASGSASFGISSSTAGSVASDYAFAAPTIASVTGSITPRTLTANASIGGALTKTYDGTNAATGATVSGGVAGAIAGDTLTLDLSGVSLAYNGSHVVGTNAIVASGSGTLDIASSTAGSVASDYTFTAPTIASVTASITPRTLTSSASIGGTLTKTYDGTTSATGATVSGGVAGAIAGDTLALDLSGVSLAYNGSHVVGTNAIVASGSASFGISSSTAGSVASDYAFTAPTVANAMASITPRTLTANASIGGALTKTYDGTDAATGATVAGGVAGAIAGDTLALDLSGVSLAYNGSHVVGTNAIVASGSASFGISSSTAGSVASDYAFTAPTVANAAASITPRTLIANASIGGALTKTYDDTDAATGATVSGSVTGAIAGDTLTLDLSGVSLAYNGSHVIGTNAIVASGSGALDIASSTAGSVASDYTFTAPTIANAIASITPRTLTANASIGGALTKTYDGTNAATGATVSGGVAGAIAGDTLTLDLSGVSLAYNGSHVVGTNAIVARGSGTLDIASSTAGSVASDYAFTAPTIGNATASITPRTLTSSASIGGTLTKTYDGTDAATGATVAGGVTGAIAGDTLTLDLSGVSLAYNGSHVVGTNAIVASGNASFGISSSTAGSVASDYAFAAPTIANAIASITPRTLTANASIGGALTKTYDGTDAATGATVAGGVTGAIAGDTLTLDLSGVSLAYNGSHVVGTNAIVASGSGALDVASSTAGSVASDYTFTAPTIASVTASITPRMLIANASIGGTLTKTYDGTDAATGATVAGGVTGAIAGDTLALDLSGVSLAYNGSHVVGTNAIIASGSGTLDIASSTAGSVASDYAFAAPTIASVTASITPRTLTSSASIGGALTKTYDGTNAATGATVSGGVAGAIAGDTLALDLSGVSLAYNGSHVVGTNAIVARGSGTLDIASSTAGSVASDYAFTAPTIGNATASITPRPLTLTAPVVSKVEDGTTAAAGHVAIGGAGLAAGDALADATLSFDTPSVGVGKKVTPSGAIFAAGTQASDYAVRYVADANGSILAAVQILPLQLTPRNVSPSASTASARIVGGPESVQVAVSADAAAIPAQAADAAPPTVQVTLVAAPSATAAGRVEVAVDGGAGSAASSLRFRLPAEALAPRMTATLADGSALPAWLSFDPADGSFTAATVPAGALPLEVLVDGGGRRFTVRVALGGRH